MLLNIQKQQLGLGMFVEAVACPRHEFRKKRFILNTQADLDAILASSAQHVQINSALGQVPAFDTAATSMQTAVREAAVGTLVEGAASELSLALRNLVSSQVLDLDGLGKVSSALGKAVEDAPDVFLKVTRLKTKDTVTYLHSIAVSALMMRVGQIMDLCEETVKELGMAGLVHDFGKLLIEDAILKKPGALRLKEKAMMRKHPQIGHDLLVTGQRALPMMLDVCLWHHELLDGSGYPQGLKAAELPEHCRIAAVCDVFEALTSVRPYKQAWPAGKALRWLYDQPQLYDYRIVGRLHEGIMCGQSHRI